MLFTVSEHCNVLAVLDLEGQKYITDEVIPIDEPTLEFPDVIQDDICASSELPTVTLTVSNVEGSTAQRVEWRSFSTSSKRCGVQYKLIYHKKHKPTEIIRHTFKEDGVFQTGNLPADTDYIYELKLSKPGLANSITRSTSQTLRTHKTLICNQFHSWNKATGTWTDKGTNGQLKGSHTGFVTIFALPLKAVTYACLVKQTIRLDRKITVRRIESGENHLNVKWGKLQPGNTVHVTVLGVKPTFKRSVGTKIRVGSLDACTNYHVLVELLNGNEVIESKQLIEVMTSYPALNAPENFDVKSLSGGLGHKLTWTPITSKYPSTCRLSYRVERESRKADKVEKQIFELNEAKLELADIASEVEYSYKVQAVFNSVHYGKFSEPLKIAALSSKLTNLPKYILISCRTPPLHKLRIFTRFNPEKFYKRRPVFWHISISAESSLRSCIQPFQKSPIFSFFKIRDQFLPAFGGQHFVGRPLSRPYKKAETSGYLNPAHFTQVRNVSPTFVMHLIDTPW
ncbi:hypothetical protein CSKR_107335 [Clonorchis sinensis]|uniref:Uncharacterized protein n=1 Tax=Clonorchis sinensis TaxID=79923 RepID=A0A419QB94_CLOSI|nr:hypothetical protein CSKR_107335 [Clonorchis sinensis]